MYINILISYLRLYNVESSSLWTCLDYLELELEELQVFNFWFFSYNSVGSEVITLSIMYKYIYFY